MSFSLADTDTIVLIETSDGNMAPSVHSLQTSTNTFPTLLQSGASTTASSPDNHVYKANLILVQEKMKLEQKVEQIQREKLEMEQRYKVEIQRLKAKVNKSDYFNPQPQPSSFFSPNTYGQFARS